MHLINSIKGEIKIQLMEGASLSIGKFLMTTGPLYLKCTENGTLVIGDNCFFNHNCSLTCAYKIEIGHDCAIANNVIIIDHDHEIVDNRITSNLVKKPIIIGNNVWIGANVTILKGVKIGDSAVIAAGAVVNRDVEAFEIVGGVPIKTLKKRV